MLWPHKKLIFISVLVGAMSLARAQEPPQPLPIEVIEQLPDAVKPGAQLPQDEFLYPELEPEPGKYIVPPVVDRPLGDTEGPKIKIEAIELRGAVDRADVGLPLSDVWKVVEEDRAASPDGYYIGQLQVLADKITDLYRSRGFIVAHAFVPVQVVEDGVVVIQVLEGVLGQVLVEGNEKYTVETLKQSFEPMVGQPLLGDKVESLLIRLSDYPGLTSFGVFQPGQKVGESDVVLKVQEEKPFDMLLSIDNHGSRFTGEYLGQTDVGLNNVFGQSDRIDFSIQRSMDPSLYQLVSFDYRQPIFKPQYWFEFGRQNSDFSIDSVQLATTAGIQGETRTTYLRFRDRFERGRLRNAYWLFSLDHKVARIFNVDVLSSSDRLASWTLEYGFDKLDIKTRSFSNLVLQWTHGENDLLGLWSSRWLGGQEESIPSRRAFKGEGEPQPVTSRFDKFTLSYAHLATLSPTRSLLFRALAQYTDDPLLGLEQFTMGGPDSVRAYPVSEVTVDRGFFLSAEHIWNAPGFTEKVSPFGNRTWGEILTVSTFVDWALGEVLHPAPTAEGGAYASLRGWGVGGQLAVPDLFTAKISAAWPILESPYASNERKPQFYFSLQAELF